MIGNLEPVARLGMTRVLEDGGLEVGRRGTTSPDQHSVEQGIGLLQPDTIVLGFEAEASSDLGDRVRVAAPGAKLILWPRDETEMQVFDPGSSAPRRIVASASDALLRELHTRSIGQREGSEMATSYLDPGRVRPRG